jgi:hypothetical protein
MQPSASPLALAIDRWIWAFMAVLFIAITLAGFVPDSIVKIEMVRAGARPPFPTILHVHAVLMGAFLLLLLAQTILMATGRRSQHMLLGLAAFVLVPVIVIAGIMLVPTIYQQVWHGAQAAPPPAQEQLKQLLLFLDNITLLQLRIGILFPLCIGLALHARRTDSAFHKRMMLLATALLLAAAIDRIGWLPNTHPTSQIGTDLYMLLAVAPMFLWDVIRHQPLRAYVVWMGLFLPVTAAVYLLWDTQGWHAFASQILKP